MSTTLHRLESVKNPQAGGILIRYGTGHSSVLEWQGDGRLILPTLHAAKHYTAAVVADLQAAGRHAEVQGTNWVSVVAAVQAHIEAFNALQRARINALPDSDVSVH